MDVLDRSFGWIADLFGDASGGYWGWLAVPCRRVKFAPDFRLTPPLVWGP